MEKNLVLGIDIGASAVKGGIVDLDLGKMISERFKVKTGTPALKRNVVEAFKAVVEHFSWKGKIGVGFPGIVKNNVIYSASNVDDAWLGENLKELFWEKLKLDVSAVNDADAAGLAERTFGAGKDIKGTVLLLTIGTGIGSTLFSDGVLVPNTEFGHLFFKGKIAEKYCSSRTKEVDNLSMKKWAKKLNKLLLHLELLLNPNLILISGGISGKFEKYEKYLKTKVVVKPAEMRNIAGIVGAAMAVIEPA